MGDESRVAGRLADAFQMVCSDPQRLLTPRGYRDSGVALVDAVFSMTGHYTAARRATAAYATWAGLDATPGLRDEVGNVDRTDCHSVAELGDSLRGMLATDAATIVFGNRTVSQSVRLLKAELVMEVADRLVDAGLRSRADVAQLPTDPAYRRHKRAWTSVYGLGTVTFEYFRGLCGAETGKPDVMVHRWLAAELGRGPGAVEALTLLAALTDELSARWDRPISVRAVDHTIWRHVSGRGLNDDQPA